MSDAKLLPSEKFLGLLRERDHAAEVIFKLVFETAFADRGFVHGLRQVASAIARSGAPVVEAQVVLTEWLLELDADSAVAMGQGGIPGIEATDPFGIPENSAFLGFAVGMPRGTESLVRLPTGAVINLDHLVSIYECGLGSLRVRTSGSELSDEVTHCDDRAAWRDFMVAIPSLESRAAMVKAARGGGA